MSIHRRHFLRLAALSACVPALHAEDEPEPAAEDIQRLVKLSYIRQDMSLKGVLRNDATDAETPFNLAMQDNTIRFRFDNPAQIVNLDLNDKGFTLYEVTKGSKAEIKPGRYTEKIRGTDMTYEDLSLRFLYWPNPVKLENETVSHRTCWRLRLSNPGGSGAYGTAFLWVDKGSGGLLQMQGYDRQGKLIKQYKVISGMKVGNGMMLKEMRIESFDPSNSKKVVGRTYLELEKP